MASQADKIRFMRSHEIEYAQLLGIPCARRAGAIGKVDQLVRRYRSRDENGACINAAGRYANAPECKLWFRLTPVEFLAFRIDILHVEDIFEQHARHVANIDYTALWRRVAKVSPGTYEWLRDLSPRSWKIRYDCKI